MVNGNRNVRKEVAKIAKFIASSAPPPRPFAVKPTSLRTSAPPMRSLRFLLRAPLRLKITPSPPSLLPEPLHHTSQYYKCQQPSAQHQLKTVKAQWVMTHLQQ